MDSKAPIAAAIAGVAIATTPVSGPTAYAVSRQCDMDGVVGSCPQSVPEPQHIEQDAGPVNRFYPATTGGTITVTP